MTPGAHYLGRNRCQFTVWAPLLRSVELQLLTPQAQQIPMQRADRGYWTLTLDNIAPGTRYLYHLHHRRLHHTSTRPDPASFYQPDGVHQASAVVDHTAFTWTDSTWQGHAFPDLIIYELHVGTITPEGSFAAIIPRLSRLVELGINAIEIMPVAQCPGRHNWGYDGVHPYAVQNTYGGPNGFKQLVNACHQHGLSVILDVVYNHLGPEGNYFSEFGPYFTDHYRNPWGSALNFDCAHSEGSRTHFLENALYWFNHFHIDGLRLDATQDIYDCGARHFLSELADRAAAASLLAGRPFHLIAESDANDVRLLQPQSKGGFGLQGQWTDDFYRSLHAILTGERHSYYSDYGHYHDLAKSLTQTFVYDWRYSEWRQRYHGNDVGECPPHQFVVYSQNHDQTGNRPLGERLSTLISFEKTKLAAAIVLLSPYIPMLFMGEEYAETAPFLYFVDHSDQGLLEAIRRGRRAEFKFQKGIPIPDIKDPQTAQASVLNWSLQTNGSHQALWKYYQHLIHLRRTLPALQDPSRDRIEVTCFEEDHVLVVRRWCQQDQALSLINFKPEPYTVKGLPIGQWSRILESNDSQWSGPGSMVPEGPLPPFTHFTIAPESIVLLGSGLQ